MRKNIQEKGFDFSIRVAELVQFLRADKLGFPLSERLLSCGVGAGLACRKAVFECGSAAEYAGQAAELVTEVDYIIDMARVAGYLTAEQCVHIQEDCKKLNELLVEPDNYDEKRTKNEENETEFQPVNGFDNDADAAAGGDAGLTTPADSIG